MRSLRRFVLRQEEIVPALRLPRWMWTAALLVVVVVLAVLPLYASAFTNYMISLVFIYALAGMGLNLLTGYSGQISIGHNFFFAIGAYTAAILGHRGVDPLWAFPVAAVLCLMVGFLVGLPALRMGPLEFSIVTLALALILPAVVSRLEFITNGHSGLTLSIKAPAWTGLYVDQYSYYWCLVLAVLGYLVFLQLCSGRVGRSLVAIRDYPAVAQSVGVRSAIVKTQVFGVSAVYAALAGVLYAFVVQFVASDSFGINMSIAFVTMIVIGGLSTSFGAIVGAIFVVLVPQVSNGLEGAGAIYGVALIAVVFLLPTGIVGAARLVGRWVGRKIRGRTSPSVSG